jgi:hypothetical protein
MTNNVEFEKGIYGTKAVIKGQWHDAFLKLFKETGVQELELNDGKGWRGDNLDFLKNLTNLKSIIIIDLGIKSIDAVHSLIELEKLEISTYSNTSINFNAFPKLVDCSFEWSNGSASLFEMVSIKKLFINNYKEKNCDKFSKLINLEKLSILNSPIENLQGLSELKNIKALRLGNLMKLTSLQGLQNLHKLEDLEIQRCKGIYAISEVFELKNLECLSLVDVGNIESIKGIEILTNLKVFLFYESTNVVDGDLTPITKLNSLKKISFQNRKHYSHRRENFEQFFT